MSPVIGAFAVIARRWCLCMPCSATTLVLGTCVALPMGLPVLEPLLSRCVRLMSCLVSPLEACQLFSTLQRLMVPFLLTVIVF